MAEFICTTCGAQYPTSDAPPSGCRICQDERQYIGALGQGWSTLALMRRNHFCNFRQMEPGLMGIGVVPQFAIGQRGDEAYLRVRSGGVARRRRGWRIGIHGRPGGKNIARGHIGGKGRLAVRLCR